MATVASRLRAVQRPPRNDDRRRPTPIAAIAAPPGRGGIGVVRVSGGAVPAIAAALVPRPRSRRAWPRWRRFAARAASRSTRASRSSFPRRGSYTGEDVLELHGHGGPAVLRAAARALSRAGGAARPARRVHAARVPQRQARPRAGRGRGRPHRRATATAARAAARSLTGAFSARSARWSTRSSSCGCSPRPTLDFPEEDIDFLRAADARGGSPRSARGSRGARDGRGRARCCATG